MNIGVCGVGTIASWISSILNQLGSEKICLYACAASHREKAEKFASQWGWKKAYGSTDELIADPDVDVVYIAVPNNAHYELTKKAILAGKNVVVEKPFAVNDRECEELIALAKEKDVFLSEALWPAFLPSHKMINEEIAKGSIGDVVSGEIIMLDFVMFLERVQKMETGGGSLLDGGPYSLGCLINHFGSDIESFESTTRKLDTGVDAEDSITVTYKNGVKVFIRQTIDCPREQHDEYFEIVGTKGKIRGDVISNPKNVQMFDLDGNVVKTFEIPAQIVNQGMPPVSGYEHEWIAIEKAISEGKKETDEVPLSDTLAISRLMTGVRRNAGIVFPFEK